MSVTDLSFNFATKAAEDLRERGEVGAGRPANSRVASMFAGIGAPPSMRGPAESWEDSAKRLREGVTVLRQKARQLEQELPFLVYAQEQVLRTVQPAVDAALLELDTQLAALGYQRLDLQAVGESMQGGSDATSPIAVMEQLFLRATVEFVQQVAIQPVPEELVNLRRDFEVLPEHQRPQLPLSQEAFEAATQALEARLGDGAEALDRTGLPRDPELRAEYLRMSLLHSRLGLVDMYSMAAEGLNVLAGSTAGVAGGAGEFIAMVQQQPPLASLVKPYLPPQLRDTVEMLPGIASMLQRSGFAGVVKPQGEGPVADAAG